MKQKFRYLGPYDRAEIEYLHNSEATVARITDKVGAHTVTISRELPNGYEQGADGEMVVNAYGQSVYRVEIVQRTFEQNIKNREKWVRTK